MPDPPADAPSEATGSPPEPEAAAGDWQPLAGGLGLALWLIILVGLGGGGLLAGQLEMAGLVAVAGLFATAQAADLDSRWRGLYRLLAWVVPVGGALLFVSFANVVYESDLLGARRAAAFGTALSGALVSLLTLMPWFTRQVCAWMFRTSRSSHVLRLTARMILLGAWLSATAGLAANVILEPMLDGSEPLFSRFSPTGQTIGSLVLALGAVGFLVRRDLRATLDRLGLERLRSSHVAVVAIGVVALFGLNAGTDTLQHWLFPALWERDHQINTALALGLTLPRALLIGLMAGIGEEVTLRGALQPKLGLLLTSLFFAMLHVQYSWFGMAVILGFGLILGLIRMRTNTTVAVLVHAVYDMIALVTVT